MRTSADDLELSCDETVLLESDEAERSQYASLILNTTGDERGFTTCLSASARALRYRLANIVKPKKRFSGAIIISFIAFFMLMSSGYIALSYETYQGSEILFDSKALSEYDLVEVSKRNDDYNTIYHISDEEAVFSYLSELTLEKITGNYSFSEPDRSYFFQYETAEDSFLWITLSDHIVKIFKPGNASDIVSYYLSEPTDWNYLDTMIKPYPALNIILEEKDAVYGKNINTTLDCVYDESDIILYQSDIGDSDVNGVFGYQPVTAEFFFSQQPIPPYTVRIESWDKSNVVELSSIDFTELDTVPLPDDPAYYTVIGEFSDMTGNRYMAEFRFNVGEIDSE